MTETANSQISFIMPAYNCAGSIEAAISSIVDGNHVAGDEIVVVNDGSTDSTASVGQKIAAALPYVQVIAHGSNRGGGAARNTAIDRARHPLIFCLDADNVLEPGSVRKLVRFMSDCG